FVYLIRPLSLHCFTLLFSTTPTTPEIYTLSLHDALPILPEIDKRIESLKDERANLDGAIAAALARKKFAERFAAASPAGLGEKGEARPVAEWRNAFAAVGEEVGQADAAIRDAERKQRDIDREIARLQADRADKPPSKLEVQIE